MDAQNNGLCTKKLLDGLENVEFIEKVKTQQKNWIGRSEGAEVDFTVPAAKDSGTGVLTVYTTRPDTLFGATYMVVSPEHPMIEKLRDKIENYEEVLAYKAEAAKKNRILKERKWQRIKQVCH